MKILAGDIGGTNTRLIYGKYDNSQRRTVAEKNYLSKDYADFDQVLKYFLSEHNIPTSIDAACFAIAGPIKSGVAEVTNLPWVIKEKELKNKFRISNLKLINDFVAVVYGLDLLQDEDIQVLQSSKSSTNNTNKTVVLGAGTGFGVAYRVCVNNSYHVYSTEAGHTGFSPENEIQCHLLNWLLKDKSHVSLEDILSGKGIITIYKFLQQHLQLAESNDVIDAMRKSDPSQVITDFGLSKRDNLSQKTLEFFVDIYGSAAANAALSFYPIDELFIAGGIAPKIKDKLTDEHFINAFISKGLMSSSMKNITVKLVLQDKVGLNGSLSQAMLLLK